MKVLRKKRLKRNKYEECDEMMTMMNMMTNMRNMMIANKHQHDENNKNVEMIKIANKLRK